MGVAIQQRRDVGAVCVDRNQEADGSIAL